MWGGEDAQQCKDILEQDILPKFQYGWYLEVGYNDRLGDLYGYYDKIVNENFRSTRLTKVEELWDVFRGIFTEEVK